MQQPWDSRKNAINKRKHGISLELALLVFDEIQMLSPQRTTWTTTARCVTRRWVW